MLNNIRLKDDEYKEINIYIDDALETLQVKEIDKLQTYINLNKSLDTALYENIEIDAFLYYHPYDEVIIHNNDSLDEHGVVQEATTIDNRQRAYVKGTVNISITDNDNRNYYYNSLKIVDGVIQLSIPNTLRPGQYILTIEYLGNLYYSQSTYQSIFQISKRPINCIFEYSKYYVDAGKIAQIPAKLIDSLNQKTINNYNVQYVFNNEVNNAISNSEGEILINALVPNPDISHCNLTVPNIQYNDTEYLDEDGNLQQLPIIERPINIIEDYDTGYHSSAPQLNNQVIYPLTVFLFDNDTYELIETTVLLVVNKVDTETVVKDFALETNNGQSFNVNGYIKTNSQVPYAQYGYVNINFPKNNYQKKNIKITDGFFEEQILMADIENVAINEIYQDSYNTIINNINTRIEVSDNEIEIEVEDFIEITAHVKGNGDSIVNVGMIIFSLQRDGEERYRHVSELDNSGTATFNYLVTRTGTYTVKVQYVDGVLGYKDSETEVIVEVDE
jgi:hypothetical protein